MVLPLVSKRSSGSIVIRCYGLRSDLVSSMSDLPYERGFTSCIGTVRGYSCRKLARALLNWTMII